MEQMIRQELSGLDTAGLLRNVRQVSSPQGRAIILDGKHVLNFCSNDYLGLSADARLAEAARQALLVYGVGSGASRLVSGNTTEHAALEAEIVALKKTEAAIVFNSGYAANTGIISALMGRDDIVFSDRLNHASMVDGIILSRARIVRYPHRDVAALEEALAKSQGYSRKLIVTDTVFSMDGAMAPLADIAALAKKHHAWLMVDEAHAFG
ncbi:MAG: aminotransferase class I/II-fold pyridoxal phosphate-dependent enzyme, partial [Candidatus Omnitrophica bacterium]|nr:aminotransferase class I/II-fold pyridoxal phosphate-dependent enzyme [Candidatus Omnitrophota bacterium]